jgi:hypothetical protein
MPDTNPPAFAEIAEADATERTREIYDDFKASIGLPMVNLVYRHMATTPGCLEWAWALLKPHFVNGAFERAGEALVASLELGDAISISGDALRRAGVDAAALSTITRTLDAYNRANPMNLIALAALKRELEDPAPGGGTMPTEDGALPRRPTPALPPMAAVETLPAETRSVLLTLAAQAGVGATPVVPTLYRHLTDWPDFLELAAKVAAGPAEDGRVDRGAHDLQAAADRAARRLPRYAPSHSAPNARQRQNILDLIGLFPALIARMIVIGAYLRRAVHG